MSVGDVNEGQGHRVLRKNNDEINKWLALLKHQREELTMLIQKQEAEKKYLKTEIDRLRYKYQLVTKSLNQRIMTKERYDQTITEAEALFNKIVVSSDTLLGAVKKDAGVLEETINKKVGTESLTLTPSKLPQMEAPISLMRAEQGATIVNVYGEEITPHINSQIDCVFEKPPPKPEPVPDAISHWTLLDIGQHRTQADSTDYLSHI